MRKVFQHDKNERPLSSNAEINLIDELHISFNDSNHISSLSSWKSSFLRSLATVVTRDFVQVSPALFEHVFNQCALVVSPRRTPMRDDLSQSMVFLGVNQHLR